MRNFFHDALEVFGFTTDEPKLPEPETRTNLESPPIMIDDYVKTVNGHGTLGVVLCTFVDRNENLYAVVEATAPVIDGEVFIFEMDEIERIS